MTKTPLLLHLLDARRRLPDPAERKAIRQRLNLSQRLIGDHVGVTAQAVQAWERGVTPGPEHLADYVELLDELRRRTQPVDGRQAVS